MSDHARNTGPMLESPRCGAKIPLADRAARRRCAANVAAACTAVRPDPARQGETRTPPARPVHQGRDRRAQPNSGLVGRSTEVAAADEVIAFRKNWLPRGT